MLKFERLTYSPESWSPILQEFDDRTVYQSPAWLAFLAETQGGDVILAALRDGGSIVGYFCGLLIHKFGVPLLGSPLPGWTTSYMGFNVQPGVSRYQALSALRTFAFHELHCPHFEVMDRRIETSASECASGFGFRKYNGFEIDLSHPEDTLFHEMAPDCRRSVRRASRCGVHIEQADDAGFAEEYYAQLIDVFARQKLTPTYDIGRVRALIRHLYPTGNLLLLRARNAEGRSIATGMFAGMHDRAYALGTASWRAFRNVRPNELLMWSAMQYWKAHGVRFLDLGGGGDYKRKYGARDISVLWLRASRYPFLSALRKTIVLAVKAHQHIAGTMRVFNSSLVGALRQN